MYVYALKGKYMLLQLHGVRMWVTESCNAFCPFCMNIDKRSNGRMELSKFSQLCQYFAQYKFDKIAIMGGEPTTHPDFLKFMTLAQEYFNTVYLFTNALNRRALKQYVPRENDAIIYNFNFPNALNEVTLLLDKPGERILDIVVDSHTNVNYVVERIIQITAYDRQRLVVQLVINNCCNIFLEKHNIIKNINKLYNMLNSVGNIRVVFECNAPLCFTFGSQLPPFRANTFCTPSSILIDASYNVRFCNIFANPLVNMFHEQGILPFSIIKNYMEMSYYQLQLDCLDKICKDCLFYGSRCNGKCYIGQDKILREDIIRTTELPWLI